MHAPRRLTLTLSSLVLSMVSCSLVPGATTPPPARVAPSPSADLADLAEGADGETGAIAAFLTRRQTGLLPSEIAEVARTIVAESSRAGLPSALVVAVIEVESSGNNFAVSPVGALGLMQLLPATGEAVAARIGVGWRGPATLFDPVANVRLGVSYLRTMVRRFGSVETALAAYNWGPTRISARLRRGEPVPVIYAERVRAAYGRRLSET